MLEKSLMTQVNNKITLKCKLSGTRREAYFSGKISNGLGYMIFLNT